MATPAMIAMIAMLTSYQFCLIITKNRTCTTAPIPLAIRSGLEDALKKFNEELEIRLRCHSPCRLVLILIAPWYEMESLSDHTTQNIDYPWQKC
jgi:hypothetical protein